MIMMSVYEINKQACAWWSYYNEMWTVTDLFLNKVEERVHITPDLFGNLLIYHFDVSYWHYISVTAL